MPPYTFWQQNPKVGRIPPHRTDTGAYLISEPGTAFLDHGERVRLSPYRLGPALHGAGPLGLLSVPLSPERIPHGCLFTSNLCIHVVNLHVA